MDFLFTGLLLIYIGFLTGATDITSAPLLGSKFLSPKKCIAIAAFALFLGSLLFRKNVEETVGEELLKISVNNIDVLVILFTTAIWMSLARIFKLPISLTYLIIGSSVGVGMFKGGVNLSNLAVLLMAWLSLPFLTMLLTILLIKIFDKAFKLWVRGLRRKIKVTRIFFILLFLTTLLTEFSKGGNDGGNAIAFVTKIYQTSNLFGWIIGASIALGLVGLGEKVVKNVGLSLVELDPVKSLGCMFSTSLTLFFSTLLGIPISATYLLIASLVGVGIGKKIWVNLKNLNLILAFLIISFLLSVLTSFLIESAYYQYS